MECLVCGVELESSRAKTCSPRCRKLLSRKQSVTENVSVTDEIEESVTFEFTVPYNKKPGEPGYDPGVEAERKKPRKAKYWYDVPIAAIPVIKKGWPEMPDYLNGRQYFLWWKNEFKTHDNDPVIHNPWKKI